MSTTTTNTTNAPIRPASVILAEITNRISEYNAEGFTGESVPEDLANLKKEYNIVVKKETFRAWAETDKPLETACKTLFIPAVAISIDKTSATLDHSVKSIVFDIREFVDYLRANPAFREAVKDVPATFKYDLENLAIAFDIRISETLGSALTPAEIAEKHKRSKANATKTAVIVSMSKTQYKNVFTTRAREILPTMSEVLPVDLAYLRDAYTKRANTLTVKGAGTNVFVKLFAEVLFKHINNLSYGFEFQTAKEKAATAPTSAPETNLPNSAQGIGDIVKEQAEKLNNPEPTTNENEQ